MRRRIYDLLICGLLVLAGLLTLPGVALAGAPDLTTVDSQVTVLNDGQLDVKYSLTFLETEPRDRINTLGPLDPGHRLLDAAISGPDGTHTISPESKGGGFYTVPFGMNTRSGESYTVIIHYHVERALDTTVIDGINYRVLSWAPVQWNLPMAGAIMTALPTLLVYVILGRYFIRGLLAGSVKG